MNLNFSLICVFILLRFLERLHLDAAQCSLNLRVLTNDLGLNFHVNNGRHLTFRDLGRMYMFICTGLLRSVFKHKKTLVIAKGTSKGCTTCQADARANRMRSLPPWNTDTLK
jgi:hypothetical protein